MELIKVGDMYLTPEIDKLAEALSNVQSKLPKIKKNREAWSYKYADLNTILEQTYPVLKEEGLSVFQSIGTDNGCATIRTTLLHISGQMMITEAFQIPGDEGGKMSALQGLGSAITYGRRYQISPALGIVTEEDTDGAGDSKETPARSTESDSKGKTPEKGSTPPQGGDKGGKRPEKPITEKQLWRLGEELKKIGFVSPEEMAEYVSRKIKEPVSNIKDLTVGEAKKLIEYLFEVNGAPSKTESDVEPF